MTSRQQGIKVENAPAIGIPFISINHKPSQAPLQPQTITVEFLSARVDMFAKEIMHLQREVGDLAAANDALRMRCRDLEARTWWSMLKDWINGLLA